MRDEVGDAVGVTVNQKVKPPTLVDAGLPAVSRFVVFLGAKGWVMQIANQVIDLLDEGFLDRQRSGGQLFDDTEGKVNVHRDLLAGLALRCHLFRKAATSAPFLKGP